MFGHGNSPDGAFTGHGTGFYNVMARSVLRRVYRRLARDIAAEAPRGATLLDVGTGPGVLLVELARQRPDLKLTGVDLSADMITAAKRNLAPFADRADAITGDVTDLPLPDASVDVIVSSFSLHHWADPEAAVPELARVLRPGGRVIVYDFARGPFDKLIETARTRSVLHEQPPQRGPIRTGIPFAHHGVKLVLSA